VNPVTEGERIVCVTWLQSMIRDTEKREILFQLKYLQEAIGNGNSQSLENLMLLQLYSNLTRMWAEL
jgi:PKHD-type hydroxylase